MTNGDHVTYTWHNAALGGGGYITGFVQDHTDPHILYARCDVAGVFKSEDGARSWRAMNNGMRDCHDHSVRSLALDPQHPQVLFRCSGEARGQRIFGTIHKSIDGAESWVPVCHAVDFYGNGPTRSYGEVIAIDPFDGRRVVAGGYSAGVWISTDAGAHWSCAGLVGERITCVAFHPLMRGRLYVGTVNELHAGEGTLEQLHDVVRPHPNRLYVSSDGGQTWDVTWEGVPFAELAFDRTHPAIVHAACLEHGLLKSVDGGQSWMCRQPQLSRFGFGTVTTDPHRPNLLYAAAASFGDDPHDPPIGLYRSHDAGESWQLVAYHTQDDLLQYPPYMGLRFAGWATSKIRVDAQQPSTLYMSNWYGVATSRDGGRTWNAHDFKGTETTCIEHVLCDPVRAQTLHIALADHTPNTSRDNGQTYYPLAGLRPYTSGTALVASRHQDDLLIYGLRGHAGACLARSLDAGKTAELVMQWRAGLFVQALAEDYFVPGTCYAYLDGPLEAGAGLYCTRDWGVTWQQMPVALPAYIRTLPHQSMWIEAELLSVVVYQVKNVCGTNQLLCADPHQPNTLYVGERTEGLFMTSDDGVSWTNIGSQLPFKQDRASVLSVIRCDEQRPGVLYAGFIREGVWHSTDRGCTWHKLFPHDDRNFNATSIAIGGPAGPEIYVASEPLYWSPCRSSVWMSPDHGATWHEISDPRLGAIRWKGIAVERSTGVVHAVSCGNGCFYAVPERP